MVSIIFRVSCPLINRGFEKKHINAISRSYSSIMMQMYLHAVTLHRTDLSAAIVPVLKISTICHGTCENWLSLVNSFNYYGSQTHGMYNLLPHLVEFRLPENTAVPKNVVLFGIKDL